jgi:phospholipid-binding lipoprotein MlaA
MRRFSSLRLAACAALLLLAGCAGNGVRETPAAVAVEAAPVTTAQATGEPSASLAIDAGMDADASAGIPAGDPDAADAVATTPGTAPADGTAPTQAERDYAAIYGNAYGAQDPYNPVADPTLPDPVLLPGSYDPWEPLNRRVHAFNNVVDRTIARPLAQAYITVVPRPVRLGVGNFFNNLGQPVSALNALLQGRPGQAGQSLARFAVNSTLGLAGIFDPATHFDIPNRSEDFGQTLGVWGWKQSRYLELPLFGPRTVRDVFGLVGDAPLAPLQHVEEDKARVFLQGLQLVDVRTQLMAVDRMREGAADEYALTRDAWMQRRQYQIFNDRRRKGEDDLPEYLRDDVDPYVPVDVMPIVPGTPGGG